MVDDEILKTSHGDSTLDKALQKENHDHKKENPSLYKLCKTRGIKQAEQWIKENKNASIWEWNEGLYGACEGGHLSIVQLIA
jgi:hypothetical protein